MTGWLATAILVAILAAIVISILLAIGVGVAIVATNWYYARAEARAAGRSDGGVANGE